jgi:GntR family transcriptional regulator/MocR family aminotransferase
MTEPLFGLAIALPARRSGSRLRELHRQLRAAILDGRLRPGVRLPASRELAVLLRVSRNTVVLTYDRLASEGFLVTRHGSGTFVADIIPSRAHASAKPRVTLASLAKASLNPFWTDAAVWQPQTLTTPMRADFRVGLPDKSAFPFPIWRSLSARALRALSRTPASYAAPEGRAPLRAAIAAHVSVSRAVACEADDVIVTAGAQQAFDLLARILITPGRTIVAVEDPGYPPMRNALAAAGARVVPVPVDDEGLIVERLPRHARVICVTPSHQFPLGSAMSLRRRTALLAFAHARRAVVIEDDYDGELRYEGRPLDALQTLDDAGVVFYVGTFSKCLFPGLRLGFVIAPRWARQALAAAKQVTDWHSALLPQDTLATFITEGHLTRHLRKMRKVYADRRAMLLAALARHADDLLTPIPSGAGLHLAALGKPGLHAATLATRAAEAGIAVRALHAYGATHAHVNGLAFGYGMIAADRIDSGIRQLARLAP